MIGKAVEKVEEPSRDGGQVSNGMVICANPAEGEFRARRKSLPNRSCPMMTDQAYSNKSPNVAIWHEAAVPAALTNVRSWGYKNGFNVDMPPWPILTRCGHWRNSKGASGAGTPIGG